MDMDLSHEFGNFMHCVNDNAPDTSSGVLLNYDDAVESHLETEDQSTQHHNTNGQEIARGSRRKRAHPENWKRNVIKRATLDCTVPKSA